MLSDCSQRKYYKIMYQKVYSLSQSIVFVKIFCILSNFVIYIKMLGLLTLLICFLFSVKFIYSTVVQQKLHFFKVCLFTC